MLRMKDLRWEFGTVLPEDIKYNLCEQEVGKLNMIITNTGAYSLHVFPLYFCSQLFKHYINKQFENFLILLIEIFTQG